MVDLVAGKAKIAEDEFMLWIARVDERLQPAEVLHSVGQRIADDANVIAFFELEILGVGQRCNREANEESQEQPLHVYMSLEPMRDSLRGVLQFVG